MALENRSSAEAQDKSSGPFLAKIISHLDPKYMGSIQVEILRDNGNLKGRESNIVQAKYLSPYYGVTSYDYTDQNNDYNGTQKSYGFWAVPPDVGTTVMVIFVEGDSRKCYWIGCVQDEYMNFMVPGLAATELNTGSGKVPVAEYNKRLYDGSVTDPTKVKKPIHPLAAALEQQGLIGDETRGVTTSSARRELPSAVVGISTPGPVDRRPGAKKGKIGKYESQVTDAFISRLGGSTFVMDDGDDKFLRKGPPGSTPPEYASVENGESGTPDIPHNELIRIRTRTGHQILLHNSEDLIYIANSRGTAWIELTSNGKIDIWAADSISMHTGGDFNVTADKNINLTAVGDVNIVSSKSFKVSAATNYDIKAGADGKLTVGGQSNILAGGFHVETASQIHMNGICASAASDAIVAPRVPAAEPWDGHENLQGGGLKTIMDTFKKVGK
jgi:hypothetical protein